MKDNLMPVMRIIKAKLDEMQRGEKLFRLYAENAVSDNFLTHLGFENNKNIFVR